MTDDEFARIGEMVSNLPVFADCDEEGLVKAAEACGKILSADDGLQQVVRLVREALPEKLRKPSRRYQEQGRYRAASSNIAKLPILLRRLLVVGVDKGLEKPSRDQAKQDERAQAEQL